MHLERNRARAVQNERDFPVRRDITLSNERRIAATLRNERSLRASSARGPTPTSGRFIVPGTFPSIEDALFCRGDALELSIACRGRVGLRTSSPLLGRVSALAGRFRNSPPQSPAFLQMSLRDGGGVVRMQDSARARGARRSLYI